MKFIPSADNLPTPVYAEENSFKYNYTQDSDSKNNRIYYDAFLVDSEAEISSGDLCIVINPYEVEEYVERCDRISLDDGREVFYGVEGTRCLLCDVGRIIAATNKCLLSFMISEIHSILLLHKLYDRSLRDSNLNFFNE